ncbi:hypothetical protein FGIG_00028 [Fasciola gigantica]|uniref:Uncharacterized protein n=1 Tax=Fasciola gigantica TaxID=46835 RepID=A0A504XSH9_FASGI|nr:hypothetical protein FGIG_00028 [Fasciola gigantica]
MTNGSALGVGLIKRIAECCIGLLNQDFHVSFRSVILMITINGYSLTPQRTFSFSTPTPHLHFFRPKYGDTVYEHVFRLSLGEKNAGYAECADENWNGLSTLHSFKLIVTVQMRREVFKYHPRMNEKFSDMRRDLSQMICQHLDEVRADSQVKKDFQIECQLLQVHPITKELIVELAVQAIHLTSFGFEIGENGFSQFTQTIFREQNHSIRYEVRLLSRTYQNVFFRGIFPSKKSIEVTSWNLEMDEIQYREYLKFNDTICYDFRQMLTHSLPNVWKIHTIFCTVRGLDSASILDVQLSVFDRDLLAMNISPDQQSAEKFITSLFSQSNGTVDNVRFQPQFLRSCS